MKWEGTELLRNRVCMLLMSKAVVLKIWEAQNCLESLFIHSFLDPTLEIVSIGVGSGQGICISLKFSGDALGSCPGTTLGKPLS